ncbi:MAG: hypothetical protein U0Q07_18985 [Acidimicrobiales bacterium]
MRRMAYPAAVSTALLALLVVLAALGVLGVLGTAAPASAQSAPDPAPAKGVDQQLTVQVPERAVPPVTISVGATEPVAAPSTPAARAGTLPRTGVGPWFGPTLVAALALVALGVVLRAVARRLDPHRLSWPAAGRVA